MPHEQIVIAVARDPQIAIDDPEVDAICKLPKFTTYWENLWRECGLNPAAAIQNIDQPIHEYLPQPTISCFDLIKGLYIYEQYRNLIKSNALTQDTFIKATNYLHLSASFGCFFALNAICTNGLAFMKDNPSTELASYILMQAQKAADIHFTPGYIMLANVYRELTNYVNLLAPETKKTLFRNALQSLHTAQLLEPYSLPMINNAYQGKTILEASNGRIISWYQIKHDLLAHSGDLLKPLDIEMAYKSASIQFNQIKSKYNWQETPQNNFLANSSQPSSPPRQTSGA